MKKVVLLIVFISIAFIATAQEIKGNYAIKNVKTGMLLRIKDAISKNGTPIVAYYPENWKCMTWNFKKTDANTYQLQNLFSNKTLQPVAAAAPDVAFEEQPLVAGDAKQQYEFIPVKSVKKDTYLIKLKGTDLFITPADSRGAANSAIILAAKRDTPDQQWFIYEQAPTM
jgi:hypothetical protein